LRQEKKSRKELKAKKQFFGEYRSSFKLWQRCHDWKLFARKEKRFLTPSNSMELDYATGIKTTDLKKTEQ